MKLPIILASASPARLKLLKQIGVVPDQVLPSDADETELPKETPANLAERLAYEKAMAIAETLEKKNERSNSGEEAVIAISRHESKNPLFCYSS